MARYSSLRFAKGFTLNEEESLRVAEELITQGMGLGSPWSICELDLSREQQDKIQTWIFRFTRQDLLEGLADRKRQRGTAFLLLVAWCECCAQSAKENEVWKSLASRFADRSLSDYLLAGGGRYATVAPTIIDLARSIRLRHLDPDQGPDQLWMYSTVRLNHAVSLPMVGQLQKELGSRTSQRLLDPEDPLFSESFSQLRRAIERHDTEGVEHSVWISEEAAKSLTKAWQQNIRNPATKIAGNTLKNNHALSAIWRAGRPQFELEFTPNAQIDGLAPGRADVYIGINRVGQVRVEENGRLETFGRVAFEVEVTALEESLSLWRDGIPLVTVAPSLITSDILVFDGSSGRLLSEATPRRSSRAYIVGSFRGTVSSHPLVETFDDEVRTWFFLGCGWYPGLTLSFEGRDVLRGTTDTAPSVTLHIVGKKPERYGDVFRLKIDVNSPYRVSTIKPVDPSVDFLAFADPPTNKERKYKVGRLQQPKVKFRVEVVSKQDRRLTSCWVNFPDYFDLRSDANNIEDRLPFDGSLVLAPVTAGATSGELIIGDGPAFERKPIVGCHAVRWMVPTGTSGKAKVLVGKEEFVLAERLEAPGWIRHVEVQSQHLVCQLEDGLVPDTFVFWTSHRCELAHCKSNRFLLFDREEPFALGAVIGRILVGLWVRPGLERVEQLNELSAMPWARWFGVLPAKHHSGWHAALELAEAAPLPGEGRTSWFDERYPDCLESSRDPDLNESERLLGSDFRRVVSQDARIGIGVLTSLRHLDPWTRERKLGEPDDGPVRRLPKCGGVGWNDELRLSGEKAELLFQEMCRNEKRLLREEEAPFFSWLSKFEEDEGFCNLSSLLNAIADLESCPTKHLPLVSLLERVVARSDKLSTVGLISLQLGLRGHAYDAPAVRKAIKEQEAFARELRKRSSDSQVYSDEPWLDLATEIIGVRNSSCAVMLQSRIDEVFAQGDGGPLLDSVFYRLAEVILGKSLPVPELP